MYINMDLLSKTGGAGLRKVVTYRLACEEKDVTGIKSLKTGEETMYGDFGHVLQARLGNLKEPVIIKVFSASNFSKPLLDTELEVLKRLRGTHFQRNLARYICDFSCLDDERRWNDSIERNRRLCIENGHDELHFVVMEYIPSGDVMEFVKTANLKQVKSFLTQLVLTYADLMMNFTLLHNDVHSGNILVRKTIRKTASYHLAGKLYRVKTEGVMPVLVDFGLSKLPDAGQKRIPNSYMISEMMLAVSAMGSAMNDMGLRTAPREFVSSRDRYREKLEDMIRGLRRLLK
jgi:serine/threonine protein kinase